MLSCAGTNPRHVLFGNGLREVWFNLAEMQILEQLEPGKIWVSCSASTAFHLPLLTSNDGGAPEMVITTDFFPESSPRTMPFSDS
jgi:hypothetical protein